MATSATRPPWTDDQPADRLVADALLVGGDHERHFLRAAQLQSERARCTVVALTAVGVDLRGRVPKTWAVGATGFERLVPATVLELV